MSPALAGAFSEIVAMVVVGVDQLVERLLDLLIAGLEFGDRFFGLLFETDQIWVVLRVAMMRLMIASKMWPR